MAVKIDYLYPFDKGFFGKTLFSFNPPKTEKITKAARNNDSISDFCKHFEELGRHSLERSPKKDSLEKPETIDNMQDIFSNMIK